MKYIVSFLITVIILQAGIYKEGETLYFQKGCNACHGPQAQGLHTYPKLANIPIDDLRKKLHAYQNDKIKTPQASIMTSFAKSLNDSELETIIYFLSNFTKNPTQERYDDAFQTWGDG